MKPKIVHHKFPKEQYFPENTIKKQIVLHHTVSGISPNGDINWWKRTTARIATCIIVSRDGTVHTLFKSEYWAHHLGIKSKVFKKLNIPSTGANKELNMASIGIEIDSWGGLSEKNGKFYTSTNKEISSDKVIDYGKEIRGFRYYEKYTKEQIASVKYLLKYWNDKYEIPLKYHPEMWELNIDALKGKEGVWAHVSFRSDKSDVHPQSQLIEMLKSLAD
jgi:N-acetyl-anhydromuramyl-L-alanine amidase AmpD